MHKRCVIICLGLMSWAACANDLAPATSAPAWPPAPPPAERDAFVNFSFDQVDIRFLVKLVGDLTGRRFVFYRAFRRDRRRDYRRDYRNIYRFCNRRRGGSCMLPSRG